MSNLDDAKELLRQTALAYSRVQLAFEAQERELAQIDQQRADTERVLDEMRAQVVAADSRLTKTLDTIVNMARRSGKPTEDG